MVVLQTIKENQAYVESLHNPRPTALHCAPSCGTQAIHNLNAAYLSGSLSSDFYAMSPLIVHTLLSTGHRFSDFQALHMPLLLLSMLSPFHIP